MIRRLPALLLAVVLSAGLFSAGQPRLITRGKVESYRPGDRIDPEVFVLDANQQRVRLLDLLDPDARLVVLSILGGGAAAVPDEGARGPLWCADSFDDLAIQRALVGEFKDDPVQFLAVAVPPVYSPERYGYPDNVFLDRSEQSEDYRQAAQTFIETTEAARKSTLIPYAEVYYDPSFRLLFNSVYRKAGTGYGEVYDWQGRFKWEGDPRRYGVPTIWLLRPDGEVLREPFWGNEYGGDPPKVEYGFAELRSAVIAKIY
jgi:hypothetical protein